MKDLTEEQMRSVCSLAKNSQFVDFTKWLKEALKEEHETSDGLSEFGEMKESQGKRICMSEILELIEEAVIEIDNINNK